MSLSIGIVGLPNVGKSTLFKLLTKKQVEAANYPFCTIDPNVGVVKVPDKRLELLSKMSNSENTVPTSIEFIDIAGLVAGAHRGEGLGNKFLSNIRECDAICEVVRAFSDKNIIHVSSKVDPLADLETIDIELILADLSTVEKRLEKTKKEAKNNSKELVWQVYLLEKLKDHLTKGRSARELILDEKEKKFIKELHLLSIKPIIYVLNIDEDYKDLSIINQNTANFLNINVKLEEEILILDPEEQKEYLNSLNLKLSGLDSLIKKAYKTLDLETFFTTGKKETRAWTIKSKTNAKDAAGVIHTDFSQKFVRVEVIEYDKLINTGSEVKAKEMGLIRTEGKDYIVKDGDVCHFLIN